MRSLREFVTQVIPLFDRYPLRGLKQRNYEPWKQAVYLVYAGEPHTLEGMDKIMAIRTGLNKYQLRDEAPPSNEETRGREVE